MSLLSTGISALHTAQLGLATTQHNIANVNTIGYSRQSTMQMTNFATMTGAGSVGQGVHVGTVLRYYSDILTKQVEDAQSKSSELSTYSTMISRIDNLLADANSGLTPMLVGFFQGIQDVAANPGLVSARQSMISGAQALVTRFQTLENRLYQLYDETNTQIENTVAEVNAYSTQIAELNRQIVVLKGSGHPPNDLLDQRDQLVLELNKLVKVNTYYDDHENLNVIAGSGQGLVVGATSIMLEARRSAIDPERIVIAQQGSPLELPESYLTGGSLGGLLSFRYEALDTAANSLGQVAASIALTINAQQALGQDLLGAVAGDLGFVPDIFKLVGPKAIENSNNNGTGSVASFTFDPPSMSPEGNFYTQLTGSDYEVRFVTPGPDTFTITRLSDRQLVASGTADGVTGYNFDGLTLVLNAGHTTGDTYRLEPTRESARNITVNQEIAGDPRRIAAAMPVRTGADPANTGNAQISAGEVLPGYSLSALPRTVIYNATTGQLTVSGPPPAPGSSTFPLTYSSGADIVIDGYKFTITGAPANGDQFILESNAGGIADSRNIVKIGTLQTALTMNGDATHGVATFQVSYAQLVSQVGTQTKTALSNNKAQDIVLEQAIEARSTVAGVNLDEEAANLIKYQQSYQAAAKMMNTVSVIFDSLLSIVR
jgi:flagellar hook-associated protein 1 FlgK